MTVGHCDTQHKVKGHSDAQAGFGPGSNGPVEAGEVAHSDAHSDGQSDAHWVQSRLDHRPRLWPCYFGQSHVSVSFQPFVNCVFLTMF